MSTFDYRRLTSVRLGIVWCAVVVAVPIVLLARDTVGMHDFGNRSEGTSLRPNALNDLQLLAIHRGAFAFTQNADLRVRVFVPRLRDRGVGAVTLQACELQDLHHYLMTAKNTYNWTVGVWNVFEPWPTKDVIDTIPVRADNLGVLAFEKAAGTLKLHLPVEVAAGEFKKGTPALTLYFATGRDIQSLSVSVSTNAGSATAVQKLTFSCKVSVNKNCALYAAGSTQAFDVDMSSLVEGTYHVTMTAVVPRTTSKMSMDVPIYYHP